MRISLPPAYGFYAILTDPVRGYEFMTRLLVDYQIAVVQLRMKDVPAEVITPIATMMRALTSGTKTRLIINDHPDIAAAVIADGVHVGQTDAPYGEVRKIVGDDPVVGLSTHSSSEVSAACALNPDYIGVGPVFPTLTKKSPDPILGIDTMKKMISLSSVPAVAIGGITAENLPDVLAAGARNFCMVRPINQTTEPEKALKEILRVYDRFKKSNGK